MADPATLTAAKFFFNGGSSSRPPDPSSSKCYGGKKTLVRHLYNIAPSFKKARSLIKGSRVRASLMMRFTDQ